MDTPEPVVSSAALQPVYVQRGRSAGDSRHRGHEHRANVWTAGLSRHAGGPASGHLPPWSNSGLVVLLWHKWRRLQPGDGGRRPGAAGVPCRARPLGLLPVSVDRPRPAAHVTLSLMEPPGAGRFVTNA